MNIALACNNLWGAGGQGNFLRRAAAGLQPHGRLDVYCKGRSDSPAHGVELHPIPEARVSQALLATPVIRRRKDWIRLASDVAFDRAVERHVRASVEPPDLFVGVALQSADALRVARERGARTWLYCLNTYLPFMKREVDREYEVLREWGGAEIHPLALRRFRQECERADEIIVNSHVAAQTFREGGHTEKPIHVLHPVVDTDRFRPVEREEGGPFTVLYVGMITPRKGVHYLFDAMRRLDPTGLRLVLAGGAGTRGMRRRVSEALASLPAEQLFRDFSRDDPTEVFGQADVLVLPSVEDGFGVVALEALASGVPVITTDQCGAADAIAEGENGFVVPARDPAALAERIAWMIAHPVEHHAMRARARESALRFSQMTYTEHMAALVGRSVPETHHAAAPLSLTR